MPQIFETSAGGDIGGAKRSAWAYVGPLVSGHTADASGQPIPMYGAFAPQQPTVSKTVSTGSAANASFTYIATCTGSLSSAAGAPPLSTSLQVAALVLDTVNNKLWAWNPVSSAWVGSTANMTSTST